MWNSLEFSIYICQITKTKFVLFQSNCFNLLKVPSSNASLWRKSASLVAPGYACFLYVTVHWIQTINTIAYVRGAFPRFWLIFC